MAGYSAGEMARVEDLCYGALLPSGGECAVTLAKAVAGSEEAFAARMNEKAAELGMTQTHFVNATGLQAENHVSTVRTSRSCSTMHWKIRSSKRFHNGQISLEPARPLAPGRPFDEKHDIFQRLRPTIAARQDSRRQNRHDG